MTAASQRPAFVLFDLGGVLCQFDPDRRAASLAAAIGITPGDVSALVFESGFDAECDLGMHSETEILERFRSLGFREDIHALRRHWISAFEPVPGIIDLAAELRVGGVTVATFTDIGPVLLAAVGTLLPRHAFDQHVFSCMLGATKPDPDAFRAGLALLNASAADAFFVDDKAQNINSARTLGIRAEQVTTAEEIEAALRSVGLLDSVPRRTSSSQ